MAFKVTWADDSTTEYGDDMCFDTEGGVLKLGAHRKRWTNYFAPHQWKEIEFNPPPRKEPPSTRMAPGEGHRPRRH
jgi:hypothetical protein